ncbi:MAG: hypothetical protein K2W99_04520 [Chthoniobacterales bacterium]|nr:hypothetical protein [Chthoniobacterales bacterium]
MSAPIPPPPRNNSNLSYHQLSSISQGQGHAGTSWSGGPNKIKNNPIGGHYAGHYGLSAGAKMPINQDDEDFSADAPVRKLVEQQFESAGIRPISSKKSDYKEIDALGEEIPEEGHDLEKEMSSAHHHQEISKHLADQSKKISNHFDTIALR